MENSKIEWCHHTLNPWLGCTKVSPGCLRCYACRLVAERFGWVRWGKGNPRKRTSAENWKKPERWNRAAALAGKRHRVFCASLADVFDDEVDPSWRDDLFDLIRRTSNLDWLLLTKRPHNIEAMLPDSWEQGWPNVWLGATAEDQKRADERIPQLLRVPAVVHFLSCEPLLEEVDLREQLKVKTPRHRVDWVIAGGESGPKARPMQANWARSLRDQCGEAKTQFFFKQYGAHDEAGSRVGKKKAGRVLDGRTWDQVPVSGTR